MARFLIVLSGSGGVLDQRTAETPEECREAILDIVSGINDFHGGDTIAVTDHAED